MVSADLNQYEPRNTHPRIRACPELAVAPSMHDGRTEGASRDTGPRPARQALPMVAPPTGGGGNQKVFAGRCVNLYHLEHVQNRWVYGDLDDLRLLAAGR